MEVTTGLGSGIMLALAAGLWLVYLVPTWLRRNEYLATERNAIRLQQTLRVLAETTEVPATIRAETTARSVAEHQRALKRELSQRAAVDRARATAAARLRVSTIQEPLPVAPQRERASSHEAPRMQRSVSGRPVAPQRSGQIVARTAAAAAPPVRRAPVQATPSAADRSRSRRTRRVRSFTTLVLLAAIATGVVQGVTMIVGGVGAASVAVLAFSVVAAATSFAMLSRLAAVSRARVAPAVQVSAPVARRVVMSEPVVEAPRASVGWTPVPLPKPLYMSKPRVAAVAFDSASIAASLADAAAEAERVQREAILATAVTPITAASRFAGMGIVPDADTSRPDLNEVLRRRRAAG